MDLMVVVQGINKETGERGRFSLTLPSNPNDVQELTGIDAQLYELEILEHDFGFDIKERMWLRELNKLAGIAQEVAHKPQFKAIKEIADMWYGGAVIEALEYSKTEVAYYKEIADYKALAGKLITFYKTWNYIAPSMREFVDLDAFASSLQSSGTYLIVNGYAFYKKGSKKEG